MNISSWISKTSKNTKITPIDWNSILHNFISNLFQLIITSIIFLVIWRIGKTLINRYVINNKNFQTKMSGRSRTLSELSINIFQYTLLFFYLYGVLTILGLPVGTLLASAGVVSLALGMGAQGFVSDLLNGMVILSEGEFDIGDIVKIGTYTGTVQSLGLRTTTLKNSDGTIIYIPNRNITIVENITRGGIGVDVILQLSAENNLKLINQCIEKGNQVLKGKFAKAIKSGPAVIGLVNQASSTLSYKVHFQVEPGYDSKVKNAYLSEYIKQLKDKNIIFAVSNNNINNTQTPNNNS